MMKLKTNKISAFSLIEMMVVISIMGVFLTLVLVNLAGLRSARNTKLAQNKLVTDIRKIQGNTLSSRDVFPGVPAQFYILKIDLNKPTQYEIEVIYDTNFSPKLQTVETIYLPQGVRFDGSLPVFIDRSGFLTDQVPPTCALLAFKAPFARVIANNGCDQGTPVFTGNDSYQSIKNFVANTESNKSSSDSVMTIKLTDMDGKNPRVVIVNGISGLISFQ